MKTIPTLPHFAHWTRLNALDIQKSAIAPFSGFKPLPTEFAQTITTEILDDCLASIHSLKADPSWHSLAASASKYIALPATPIARGAPIRSMFAPILQTSLASNLDDITRPFSVHRLSAPIETVLDPDSTAKPDDFLTLPATHLSKILINKNANSRFRDINDQRQHRPLRALCYDSVVSKLPSALATWARNLGAPSPKDAPQSWMAIPIQLNLLAASASPTHPLSQACAIFAMLSDHKFSQPSLLNELLSLHVPNDGHPASTGLANLQLWIRQSDMPSTPSETKISARQQGFVVSYLAARDCAPAKRLGQSVEYANREAAKNGLLSILYSNGDPQATQKIKTLDKDQHKWLNLVRRSTDNSSLESQTAAAIIAQLFADDLAIIDPATPKPFFLRSNSTPDEQRSFMLASLSENIQAAANTLYNDALDIAKAREAAFIAELGFTSDIVPDSSHGVIDIGAACKHASRMLAARSSGTARGMALLAQTTGIHDMANLRARLGYLNLDTQQIEAFCTPQNLSDLAEILRPIEAIRSAHDGARLSASDMSFPALNALLFLVRKSHAIEPSSLGERAMRELPTSTCGELFAKAYIRESYTGQGKQRLRNDLPAINGVLAWPQWIDEAEPKLAAGAVLDFSKFYYQRAPAEFCAAFCTLAACGSKSHASDEPLHAEALRVADRLFNGKGEYSSVSLGLVLDSPQPPRLPFSDLPSLERASFASPEAMTAATLEPALESLLVQQGFPGYLAKLCILSGFTLLSPEADAQSQANIAMAGAKEASKEWLGASSAGWKLLLEAEGERKEFKKNLAKRAFSHYQSTHGLAASAAPNSWQSQLKLSGWCYSEAAARGLDAKGAKASLAGISAWQEHVETKSFDTRLLEAPLSEGSTILQSLEDLKQESLAREAKMPMARQAIIERAKKHRADDLRREQQAVLAKKKIGVGFYKAAGALEEEVGDISDWPRHHVGRFWRNLPAKFGWAEIAKGSKQWHDAQIAMQATNPAAKGPGWQACGVSYSDPDTGLSAHELLTPAALQAEGAAMRHCVGSYGERCRDGQSRIFSIRNNDVRVATLELAPPHQPESSAGLLTDLPGPWKISQLKGPCNAEPSDGARKASSAIAEAARAAMASRREESLKNTPSKSAKVIKALSRIPTELPGFDPQAILEKIRAGNSEDKGAEPPTSPAPRLF